MSYLFFKNINQEEFDEFVEKHEYCNLLQSYNWAKVKKNWDHMYTGVYKDNELVATGLVLIKRLPLSYCMYYLPRGPIMDYKNKELVQYYFDQLKKLAQKDHCIFIKFDPAIHVNDYDSKSYNINRYKDTEIYLDIFKSCKATHHGYTMSIVDTVQPRFQSNVYSYENIEETLPKHTKRLIKDADRRNVQIIHGHLELLDDFSRLVELTESRKGVALRDKEYFKTLLENYKDGGVIFLAMCNVYQLNKEAKIKKVKLEKEIAQTCENAKKKLHRLEDQLRSVDNDIKEFKEIFSEFGQEEKDIAIAGILSIQYGNTCEMLYAGMDERFKKFMPQYKEYVENFKWAFEKGCSWSNMGGVEGTLDDGLTKFKDNFNPTINEFIGEFDIPIYPFMYRLTQKAYKILKSKHM